VGDVLGRDQGVGATDWPSAAEHMGPAYLRYSFTKGTDQEVAFLSEALDLHPSLRVLDVACGPGRHAAPLGAVGVDIAPAFAALAAGAGVPVAVADAEHLPFADGTFDVAVSLCQGTASLWLPEIARTLKTGGRLAFTAFNAYFLVRHLEESDAFDPDTGTNVEQTEVRSTDGVVTPFTLTTAAFTPTELRLLAERAGLEVDHLWSVEPGRYGRNPPAVDSPEYLVLARRVG
jgi:SAM-dependent methyltransferase